MYSLSPLQDKRLDAVLVRARTLMKVRHERTVGGAMSARDEGRLGAGGQAPAPNHRKLRRSKAVVVSYGKGETRSRQVYPNETRT